MVKSWQDFIGGLAVVAVAVVAFVLGWGLSMGSLDGPGPGLMPRSVAVLLGILGLLLAISGLTSSGPGIGGVAWRALAFLLAAIVIFAFAVRPLGLAVAAPLTVLVAGLASHETRWGETTVAAVALTAFCVGLFKYGLKQPIPLAPWLLGY